VGAAAILSDAAHGHGTEELRQQQIMIRDDKVMTERESIERVEDLLRDEARANRQRGRKTAEEVEVWSKAVGANGGRGLQQGGKDEESKGGMPAETKTMPPPSHPSFTKGHTPSVP
jgi:hypothetical protein